MVRTVSRVAHVALFDALPQALGRLAGGVELGGVQLAGVQLQVVGPGDRVGSRLKWYGADGALPMGSVGPVDEVEEQREGGDHAAVLAQVRLEGGRVPELGTADVLHVVVKPGGVELLCVFSEVQGGYASPVLLLRRCGNLPRRESRRWR